MPLADHTSEVADTVAILGGLYLGPLIAVAAGVGLTVLAVAPDLNTLVRRRLLWCLTTAGTLGSAASLFYFTRYGH